MILGEDGEKMSKSRGNVVNPDEVVRNFGADAYRLYQMFIGPFDQAIPWDSRGIEGAKRFLNKVWKLRSKISLSSITDTKGNDFRKQNLASLETLLHQTIKKVSDDIEEMKFNTAISQLMILVNAMEKEKQLRVTDYSLLINLLSPFAPHISSELAEKFKFKIDKWPKYDSQKIKEKIFELVVQINGKVRDRFEVPMGISQKEAEELTLKRENVKKYLGNKKVKKVIFVPNRLINYVCS
jgi:leucyl-tRNA synthetase